MTLTSPSLPHRYKQLLFYATKLAPLPSEDHNPSNKVEGCVSQVWVKSELKEDGKVYWSADSDSQLTKGLAALLVLGLSGCTPEEITRLDSSFIELLGLKQSLTPSRNNGFLNMLRLMQKKSAALAAAVASSSAAKEASEKPLKAESSTVVMLVSSSSLSMRESMQQKLSEAFRPALLEIVDESSKHAGHAAMAGRGGAGGETHFNVKIVSSAFEGQSLVKRHRAINTLLSDEFNRGLHALSLDTRTPSEAGM
jgi:sulfur transfer protein SufE/stress-induced morphogen